MRILFCCLTILLWPAMTCYCQNQAAIPRPLSIGESFPSHLIISNVHNYPVSSVRFADVHGKLVILDFFNTWCSTCIKELPRLNALQKELQASIQIFVVSSETAGKIQSTLTRFNVEADKLPFICADSVLHQLFPHRLVPHEVWLNADGIIAAITAASQLTAANISQLLRTGNCTLPLKKDLMDFDATASLQQNLSLANLQPVHQYQSLLSPAIDGAGGSGGATSDSGKRRLTFFNLPVIELYKSALSIRTLDNNSIEWKDGSPHPAELDKTYCYEIASSPALSIPELKKIMLQDLNRYFHLQVQKIQTGETIRYRLSNP